ncbi:hypothetical protein [Parachitinimonas caeni]|uniref:Uncharacterized protein n=1 Tax=Parachitinimonas caeni TaxID=3031301 RepID=A0ABT7E1H4_9NEIS|nr:hypothetical protein [Parachitinimonas caeni]MDK2126169.1 hypothetical protein [Parachitinimonas caeni]
MKIISPALPILTLSAILWAAPVAQAVEIAVASKLPNIASQNCPFPGDPELEATLPDIQIKEAEPGEIKNGRFGLYLPQAAHTRLQGGRIKVTRTSGADITSRLFGNANPRINYDTPGLAWVELRQTSTELSGPVTITLSQFKATLPADATLTGPYTAVIGGGDTPELGENLGAQLPATTLEVASIIEKACSSLQIKAQGPLERRSLQLAMRPGDLGSDQPLALFLAAQLPDGRLFMKNAQGAWKQFDGHNPVSVQSVTAPAGVLRWDVLDGSLDVSGLQGTQIYIGYALATPAADDAAWFGQMLTAKTHAMAYIIQ